jgi:hypothetical protein
VVEARCEQATSAQHEIKIAAPLPSSAGVTAAVPAVRSQGPI